jgi:hypothetical protein
MTLVEELKALIKELEEHVVLYDWDASKVLEIIEDKIDSHLKK